MKNIVKVQNNDLVVSLQNVADFSKNDYESVRSLISKNKTYFERLGVEFGKDHRNRVDFKSTQLNEPQATFLITLMRNNETVTEFKLSLVEQFYKMREQLCDTSRLQLKKETSKLETIISNQEKKIEKLSESIYAKRRAGSSQVVTRIIKDYNIAIDPSDLNEILSSKEFGILEKEYYETYTFKPVIGQRVAIRVGQSVMMDVDSILAIVDELEIPRGEFEEKKTNLFID